MTETDDGEIGVGDRLTSHPVPMRPTVVIASTLPLIAALSACGGSLWPTNKVQLKAYAPDVYACVTNTANDLGYHSFLSDTLHREYEGRRDSKQKYFVEVDQFSAFDRLKAKVESPKTGGTATLTIQGQTLSVHETKEGVINEPEPASSTVTQDVQKIVNKCAPSTAVATNPPTAARRVTAGREAAYLSAN